MAVELSIIVPVFDEADVLPIFYERTNKVLASTGIDYEIIFIDDGSTDNSLAIVERLFKQAPSQVRYFSLSRNFGHEAATTCGFAHCRGSAAILMDADLQDPPELILKMLEKWREGYDVVAARRKSRSGESALKRFTAYFFYRLLDRFSEVAIPKDVGDFRLVDRKVIEHFNSMHERNRFVRGMFPWLGYRHFILDYDRDPRQGGKSKYNYAKLFWLSLEALSGFSVAPLRIATVFGLFISLFSLALGLAVLLDKLFFNLALPGYALLAAGMFFLGGVQILFLGLLGEYIGKIYREVQQRPLFIVKENSDNGA